MRTDLRSVSAHSQQIRPLEVSYGFTPTIWPTASWPISGNLGVEGFTERAHLNWLRVTDSLIALMRATDSLITLRIDVVSQGNRKRRRDSPSFQLGSKVYVSTKDLVFPAAISRKFIPKFIGAFPISAIFPHSSNVEVTLPPHLRVHQQFHTSKLCPHFPNDDSQFPSRAFNEPPPAVDTMDGPDAEYVVDCVVADKMVRKHRSFQVRWLGYLAAKDGWISEVELRESVDDYLELLNTQAQALAHAKPLQAAACALVSSLTNPWASSFGGWVQGILPLKLPKSSLSLYLSFVILLILV